MSRKKQDNTLTFRIDSFTPETIPMSRLAEYMADLAKMYGHEDSVHFQRMKKGSACIVSNVDLPDVPKVKGRLEGLITGNAEPDVYKAFHSLNNLLAADNATGKLTGNAVGKIIPFPGRNRPKPITYGPVKREGSLDGILTSLSGRDDTISIQLKSEDKIYTGIWADLTVAKKLRSYLWEHVRISGHGSWIRDVDGVWNLQRFKVNDFEVLQNDSFENVLGQLRSVTGSEWMKLDDPLAELGNIRNGNEGIH